MIEKLGDGLWEGIKLGIGSVIVAWAMTRLMNGWGIPMTVDKYIEGCVDIIRWTLGV